jgi:hypothetical protein
MKPTRLGVAFLLIQSAAILYAQLTPYRYFCWAPFHAQTKYQIETSINGKTLTEAEIAARYQLITIFFDLKKHQWWELNEIQHVFAILSQYESTHGANQSAKITVTYDENGNGSKTWSYP